MNNAERIAHVADTASTTKGDANKAVEAALVITAALKGGGSVALVGFGLFSASNRAFSGWSFNSTSPA